MMANLLMYDYTGMEAEAALERDIEDWVHEAYATKTGQLWPNAGAGQTAARQ